MIDNTKHKQVRTKTGEYCLTCGTSIIHCTEMNKVYDFKVLPSKPIVVNPVGFVIPDNLNS